MPNNLKPGDYGYEGPLNGIDEISTFLRISKEKFYDFVANHAPIRLIGGKYRSHTKALLIWEIDFLRRSPENIQPETTTEQK